MFGMFVNAQETGDAPHLSCFPGANGVSPVNS